VATLVEILRRLEENGSKELGQLVIEHLLGPGMAKKHHRAVQCYRPPDDSRSSGFGKSMEIVLLVSPQGSGKTTFYQTRYAATHVLVSKDRFRNNRRPQRRQMQLIEEALKEGRSVVVDNTNPTVEDRAPIIALARSYGARVVGFFLDSCLGDCLERNARRSGRELVPDKALYITLQRLRKPRWDEGFDRLYQVRLTPEGQFIVDALEE
jgi:predicted kinase